MDGRIEHLLEQRRIKKLYKEALECAIDEGAQGSEVYEIARDYMAVLRINGASIPMEEHQ